MKKVFFFIVYKFLHKHHLFLCIIAKRNIRPPILKSAQDMSKMGVVKQAVTNINRMHSNKITYSVYTLSINKYIRKISIQSDN